MLSIQVSRICHNPSLTLSCEGEAIRINVGVPATRAPFHGGDQVVVSAGLGSCRRVVPLHLESRIPLPVIEWDVFQQVNIAVYLYVISTISFYLKLLGIWRARTLVSGSKFAARSSGRSPLKNTPAMTPTNPRSIRVVLGFNWPPNWRRD